MKTKVTANATSKNGASTKTKADAKVTVPAVLKASVSKVADAISGRVSAVKREGKSWVECAEVCKKLFKTKEAASPVLKQAFEDAGLTQGMFAAYRSNILSIAYPADPKAAQEAIADDLATHQIVAASRGSLKKSKKAGGGWIKVKRAEKRGGHNKVKPLDAFKNAMVLAFTAAQTAKLDEDQCATAIAEAAEAADYDLEALGEAIAKS